MKNKVKKKQAHLKSKRQKALKRRRNAKPYRPKNTGMGADFLKQLKDLEYNLAVENMAHISFSYLEQGANFYFQSEGVSETAEKFVEEKTLSAYLSAGVRGVINEEHKLEVSKPLTWVPEAEEPTVKDYLAELWNKDVTELRQVNSFSFFVYDDNEIEQNSDEGDVPFLAGCVIVSGETKENIEGYLVMREVSLVEGEIKIDEPNIFLEIEDVLDLHIPPMVDAKDLAEEFKQFKADSEGQEDSEG